MTRRILAVSVWAISWAFAAAAIVLLIGAGLPNTPVEGVFLSQAPPRMQATFDEIGIVVAIVYGPVSALILARRPHPVGVVLAVHAVGSGLAAFGVQWGILGQSVPGLPLWGFFAFAAGWGFVPGTFMTAALPLLVTRRRIPPWQLAVVVLAGANALVAWFVSVTQQGSGVPANPFAVPDPTYQSVLPELYAALSYLGVALSFVSCAVLLARWWRARARERVAVAWLGIGQLFLTLSYLLLVLPGELDPPEWVVAVGLVAPAFGQVLYPTALLVVVLGQRLWGVEIVVSRVVLWALLSLSGVTVYLVVVVIAGGVMPAADGVWIVVPLALALAVQPARRWFQRRIDRLVYGEAADAGVLLGRIGDEVGELEPGEAGLTQVSGALRRVLRLGRVEIVSAESELRAASGAELRAEPSAPPAPSAPPQHPAPARVVALRGTDGFIGELRVWPREGQRLDRRTLTAIDDVSGLVAVAVRLVESAHALERARAELAATRAAERRAIRRELHDGLGPELAGAGFGLAAAQNLVREHPERAGILLDELGRDITRRARDLRDLAAEVSPSPLGGSSLVEGLGALADRFTVPGRRVRLRVTDARALAGDALREEVQSSLYLVAAEALSNAARHSGAGTVTIALDTVGGDARLEVADDGRGMVGAVPGVGLHSMRERATALGGTLTAEGEHLGGGTVVTLRIPLERGHRVPIGDIDP
ncbi:histidine kinase [Herbiconiux moechotypicola]|uniref:Histidine kinase/HSP90-like ATPase domain-containing protein n=1 Tax=Herbiconiux moechotypicola TaxID=637393 RepID=A0ABP5R476_9MICO|nr:ATP-binding protein [Herbiconiux moechotypicola]MCS5732038.1 histidine kinase [Herbiconiux moechotypicola]